MKVTLAAELPAGCLIPGSGVDRIRSYSEVDEDPPLIGVLMVPQAATCLFPQKSGESV